MSSFSIRIAHWLAMLCLFVSADLQGSEPPNGDLSMAFRVATGRPESLIRFFANEPQEPNTVICEVTSAHGIDRATIHRLRPEWPQSIVLRLRLKGLESLKVTAKKTTIVWTVSSSSDQRTQTVQNANGQELSIAENSPLFAKVKLVGEQRRPLQNGYFEIKLPKQLFADNPDYIRCEWIDFYRH